MVAKKKITLKDIAKKAGISINSVSKALKDSKSISQKTKNKVKKIADKLGYIPDIRAKTLRSGKLDVIAIVYDNLTNPYYSMMLEKISNYLYSKNYDAMIFADSWHIGHLSIDIAKKAISYQVSAILTFIEPTLEAKNLIDSFNLPLLLIGRDGRPTNTNSIYSDDYEGGKLAAKTLINKNSHEFLYFTEHNELEIDKQRLKGFKDELNLKNYNLDQDHIIIGTRTNNASSQLIETLKKKPNIDGIFCFSDLLAYEVLRIIYENFEERIKKIKIIGYDNTQESNVYPIRVSSVAPNADEIIQKSFEILINLINKGNLNKKIINIKVSVQYFEGTTA